MAAEVTAERLSEDLLIDLFSHRPSDYLTGVIRQPPAAKTVLPKQHINDAAPLSALEALPTEVLWMILNAMDFKSLSNLSQTSKRGLAVVQALPAYDQMMRYAPRVLSALGKTGAIKYHSAGSLLEALYSEKCVRCPKYGAYLNLLTCERCCDQCSCFDISFCVAPRPALCKLLGIQNSDLKGLPILHSTTGQFKVADGLPTSRRQRLWVVSVAGALAIAKKVHGLDESKNWAFEFGSPKEKTDTDLEQLRNQRSHEAWSEGHVLNTDTVNYELRRKLSDAYCGSLATVLFPSITAGGYIQKGLWCMGCDYAYCRNSDRTMGTEKEEADFTYSMSRSSKRSRVIMTRFHCYSRNGLLDHIQKCPGALEMLPKLNVRKGEGKCNTTWETKQRHR